jgi:tetratricopeptide (TPR) repeat protein
VKRTAPVADFARLPDFEGNPESPKASLLAPQSAPAEEPTPAPGDVVIVDQLPALTPPSPDAIARVSAPLHFPVTQSESPTRQTAVEPAAAPTAAQQASHVKPAQVQQSVGSPTGSIVNERASARIRRGYELAERGAFFAAREEFTEVLRMIAEAKDQLHGSPRRTIALADGLRALDEAADFSPLTPGGSDLKLSVIVASHRTPVAKELDVDSMLPQQLADAYLEYAQAQLGAAVAGEPAGSMALHALGKLQTRLGVVEPEKNPQAARLAFAMQQAALLARSDNHMAAHELGVLLAESGHYAESDQLLRQVAARAPHPVVYRNLARVERQLGRPDLAAMSEQQATYLASRGGEPSGPVRWVAAGELAGTPEAMGPAPSGAMMATSPQAKQYAPAPAATTARAPGSIQR